MEILYYDILSFFYIDNYHSFKYIYCFYLLLYNIMTVRKSLEKCTVPELREKAKSKKITGYSKLLKAELIAAIRDVHAKRVANKKA